MKWVSKFDFFIFDFDGLLVNTESLHFEAYRLMLASRGIDWKWDFSRYCLSATYSATKLQEDILKENPSLIPIGWDLLYSEKKCHYMQLLKEGKVKLMPGVEDLLIYLKNCNKKRCVATHSPKEQIDYIKGQHEILNSIPYWITREHYKNPKPSSDCYIKAINTFAEPEDRIIGFEDSPRGLEALIGTRALPVFINEQKHPFVKEVLERKFNFFESLNHVNF
jgi:beta-phosphoglucomutase